MKNHQRIWSDVVKNQHTRRWSGAWQKKLPKALRKWRAVEARAVRVMDILFRRGKATVAEVVDDLPDPPTSSAVRSTLRILMGKRLSTYMADGPRYVYEPAVSATQAREDACVLHMIRTFFDGSVEQAVASVLRVTRTGLSEAEIERIEARIRKARSAEE